MFSSADKVKGQGVGSAYLELVSMLRKHFKNEFNITINKWTKSDITHYHTIDPLFYLSTFSKKRGQKIGYVHFLPETLDESLKIVEPFKTIFYKYVIAFYKRMDHIVVVNPVFIDKLVAYGIDRNKITYIPNFVSNEEFYPVSQQKKIDLRKKYGYDLQKFTVLGSGQIQTRKGVLDFVKLAELNPKIQFVWTGGFSFGKMTDGYSQLEKIVKNPPKNLSFPGIISRDKMVEYYGLSDLFLLPSYNELFPMSVLESFSCNTPVMLRNLPLYKAIINGYYLPANDVSDMNKKLRSLINDSGELLDLQRKTTLANNRYSEDNLAAIWHKFYIEQAEEG